MSDAIKQAKRLASMLSRQKAGRKEDGVLNMVTGLDGASMLSRLKAGRKVKHGAGAGGAAQLQCCPARRQEGRFRRR